MMRDFYRLLVMRLRPIFAIRGFLGLNWENDRMTLWYRDCQRKAR